MTSSTCTLAFPLFLCPSLPQKPLFTLDYSHKAKGLNMQADKVFVQTAVTHSEEMSKMPLFCSALITAISIFSLTQLEENPVQSGFVMPHLAQRTSRGMFDGLSA